MIRLGTLDWHSEERRAVINLLNEEEPRLTMGRFVAEFEERFTRWIGSKYAIACNSGTSALMIAIGAYKYKTGYKSKILTSPLTFPATWNACEINGYDLIYSEIDLNLKMKFNAPNDLLSVPVHLFGKLSLSENHIMIEDACEALGSSLRGKKAGTFGVLGCFSFYPAHQVTTIEGGMVVTDDEKLAEICRALRDNGRLNPQAEDRERWANKYIGFNFKPTEIMGILGCVKMKKIDQIIARRNALFKRYVDAFESPFREDKGEYIVPLYFPIFVRNSLEAINYLKKQDIESRPMFTSRGNSGNAEWLSKHTILIPCHQDLSDSEVDYIIEHARTEAEKYG